MRSPKKKVSGPVLRVRTYEVMRRAVEEGVNLGWRRAHKHTDAPNEEAIKEEIFAGVISAVDEYFDFGDEEW